MKKILFFLVFFFISFWSFKICRADISIDFPHASASTYKATASSTNEGCGLYQSFFYNNNGSDYQIKSVSFHVYNSSSVEIPATSTLQIQTGLYTDETVYCTATTTYTHFYNAYDHDVTFFFDNCSIPSATSTNIYFHYKNFQSNIDSEKVLYNPSYIISGYNYYYYFSSTGAQGSYSDRTLALNIIIATTTPEYSTTTNIYLTSDIFNAYLDNTQINFATGTSWGGSNMTTATTTPPENTDIGTIASYNDGTYTYYSIPFFVWVVLAVCFVWIGSRLILEFIIRLRKKV